jgi:hypothetical protein
MFHLPSSTVYGVAIGKEKDKKTLKIWPHNRRTNKKKIDEVCINYKMVEEENQ